MFREPFDSLPPDDEFPYLLESVTDLDVGELNYQKVTLKQVEIAGKRVIIKQGHANKILDYHLSTDIKMFRVYAETLVIASPLRLPQTHIEIYARRLIFEGDGSLSTMPVSQLSPAQEDKDGAQGLRAGDLVIRVAEAPTIPGGHPFDLRGGNGQAAWPGRQGQTNGLDLSQSTIPLTKVGPHLIPATKKIGPWVPDDREKLKKTIYYYIRSLNFEEELRPEWKGTWPGNGEDCKLGTLPGEGGAGGELRCDYDLTTFTEKDGGLPGAPGTDFEKGGLAGKPSPAYKYYCYGGPQGYKEEAQTFRDGTGGKSPRPKSERGPSGKVLRVDGPGGSWLHVRVLEIIVRYAEDLYRLRYYDLAASLVSEYLSILDAIFLTNADIASNNEYGRLYARLEACHLQLAHALDFYGHPFDWVPFLSLEVYAATFEQEIKSAAPLLFAVHRLGTAMQKSEDRTEVLRKTVNRLRVTISDDVQSYNELQATEVGLAETELAKVENEEQGLIAQAKSREQSLKDQAEDTVEERQRKAQERRAWKFLAAYMTLLPVGQPYAGLAGATLDALVDGSDFWTTIGKMAASYSSVRKYEATAKSFQEAFAKLDFSSAEKLQASLEANRTALDNGVAGILKLIRAEMAEAATIAIPASAVEQEFERLRKTDPVYLDLLASIERLAAAKKKAFERLLQIRQKMLTLLESIARNIQALNAATRELRIVRLGFDLRSKILLEDLKARTRDRLLYFQYHFAKAYEYRLLVPYHGSFTLDAVYDRFVDIAKTNQVDLTEDDISGILEVFRQQLRDLVLYIFKRLEKEGEEEVLTRHVEIPAGDITTLNSGQLVLNLSSATELTRPDEEERRIIDIRVLNVAVNGVEGSIDYIVKHSGFSSIRRQGKSVSVRHRGYDGRAPMTWISVYYAKTNALNNSSDAESPDSLLSTLISGMGKDAMLFARPGLDSSIVIAQRSPNGLKTKSLTLLVKYSFRPI